MYIFLFLIFFKLTSPIPKLRISQQFCERLIWYPNALNSAIVCGVRIGDQQLKHALINLSLIHLFVISGLHITILLELFAKTSIAPWLIGGFVLLTGMQPPATRAMVHHISRSFLKKHFWPPDLILLFGSLCCLILQPEWQNSFSFLLSWHATGCLLLCSKIPNLWLKSALTTATIYLGLLGIGIPHLSGILWSAALAPIFLFILFPIILLSGWVPLSNTIDLIHSQLVHFSQAIPQSISTQPPAPLRLWLLIVTNHAFLRYLNCKHPLWPPS